MRAELLSLVPETSAVILGAGKPVFKTALAIGGVLSEMHCPSVRSTATHCEIDVSTRSLVSAFLRTESHWLALFFGLSHQCSQFLGPRAESES